jgi:hypothetical protein
VISLVRPLVRPVSCSCSVEVYKFSTKFLNIEQNWRLNKTRHTVLSEVDRQTEVLESRGSRSC